jgi:hypothetical protein
MEHEQYQGISSRRPLDPGRIRCALQRRDHLPGRIFADEHRHVICCGARADQCAFRLFLSKVVEDTQWDFDVQLGFGPDTDYCTGRVERLAFVFKFHACEGIHQRSFKL